MNLHDLDLAPEARAELTWEVAWLHATASITDATLARLAGHEALGAARAAGVDVGAVLRREANGVTAARLRVMVRADARPRLTPAEVEAFLAAYERAAVTRPERNKHLWRLLVTAGVEPGEAVRALRGWGPSQGVLPTGQMIPEGALARARGAAPASVRLASGHDVPRELAREVYAEAHGGGGMIHAIKRLREATGLGLGECKLAVESLAESDFDRDAPRPPPPPAPRDPAARRAMDRAVESLLVERPFHWAILAAARLAEDVSAATMAVGLTANGGLVLFYNPAFVLGLDPVGRMAVLAHEVNHVLFGHLAPPPEERNHPLAWALACEATANEFVPWPLPGEPVTLESLGLPPMESTPARFQRLRARVTLPKPGPSDDFLTSPLREGAAHHRDTVVGVARYPQALVRAAADLVGDEIDAPTLRSLRVAGAHQDGSLFERLDPEGAGSLPWDALLRRLTESLRSRRPTRSWPSRRAPERVGVVPGRRAIRDPPAVLAAIDTSGSMTHQELADVAAELLGLASREFRVAVVQCDTAIRTEGWLARGSTITHAAGRGGTDLRPPFGPDVLRRYDPSVLVYFTDGVGPAPDAPPPGVAVLWVLTGAQPAVPARWGRVVCMRPSGQRASPRPPA